MRLFLAKDFFDLVFPRTCEICSCSLLDTEQSLCLTCIGLLPLANYHLRPFDNDLRQKVQGLAEVRAVFSFLRFTQSGASQKMLHAIKYRGKAELAQKLGELYGEILYKHFDYSADALVPVPLHPLKKKRRGYNQSEEFARGLSKTLHIPVSDLLQRIRFTETQTKKSRSERLGNVDGVFEMKDGMACENLSLMLIDDVMTTGATLCSAANELQAKGAKTVDFITIAAGN
ncbi:ComF family protein [Algoriphagus namhaensis]